MAISNFNKKLEILSFLIFLYGKLIRLAVILERQGLDAGAVRQREKDASLLIDQLRSDMLRTWSGQANSVMGDLRDLNAQAQRKVRELEDVDDKIGKVADILSIIDRALALVGSL
jgi:hypothetical protein